MPGRLEAADSPMQAIAQVLAQRQMMQRGMPSRPGPIRQGIGAAYNATTAPDPIPMSAPNDKPGIPADPNMAQAQAQPGMLSQLGNWFSNNLAKANQSYNGMVK